MLRGEQTPGAAAAALGAPRTLGRGGAAGAAELDSAFPGSGRSGEAAGGSWDPGKGLQPPCARPEET